MQELRLTGAGECVCVLGWNRAVRTRKLEEDVLRSVSGEGGAVDPMGALWMWIFMPRNELTLCSVFWGLTVKVKFRACRTRRDLCPLRVQPRPAPAPPAASWAHPYPILLRSPWHTCSPPGWVPSAFPRRPVLSLGASLPQDRRPPLPSASSDLAGAFDLKNELLKANESLPR